MDQNDANTDRSGKFPKALAGAEVSDVDLTQKEIYVGGERLTEERAEQINAEVLGKVRSQGLRNQPGRRRRPRPAGDPTR